MPDYVVRNPDFEQLVRSSFAKQGLMRTYGARLGTVAPGAVEVAVPFSPELTQQQGLFHAGVTTAIADSAAGYTALTLMVPGSDVVSIEFKVNLIAPALGDELIARAHAVRSGRTITVCQADVFNVTSDGETHCAAMLATMMRIDAT